MDDSKRPLRRKASLKNYNENIIDDLLDQQSSKSSKKRAKTKVDLVKETEIEAMIALSLGFPIDKLLEEEIKSGVVQELNGKQQNDYIVVRNHILVKWRENVQSWLSKGEIRETVSSEYLPLLNSAYDFLYYNGYINFGVSPSFETEISETLNSVIIIGSGLAGLAAAKQLKSFGFKVIILEARERPGGRVYTHVGPTGTHVDLGGSVITGIHANPLGVLARQLNIPLHKVRDKCPLYKPNGELINEEIDSKVELIFNKLLDNVTQMREIMGGFANNVSLGTVLEKLRGLYSVGNSVEEKQLLNWHYANLEYANAGGINELSAKYWDQDDPYEMGGDHCFLYGGNSRLIKSLCKNIPIFYGKIVEKVEYNENGVKVYVSKNNKSEVFEGDMVLCTVPLGVLKKRVIKFDPELPGRKIEAIERLGFGLLNKVAMLFPYVFWGEEIDTFGGLNEYTETRGEFFLFYSYHTVSGGAVLVSLVAGEAARVFESTDPKVSVNRVLNVLKGIYGRKGIEIPDPIQSICTRWGEDPFSYGSYSHVRVQSSGSDYDILGESVANRLFFAGEATTRQYPATMHGAYLSGLREASNILRTTKAKQQLQLYPKKSSLKFDVLVDLFKRPDFEDEEFEFVFDSSNEGIESMGIMKYSVDESLCVYAVLTRGQGDELMGVSGGKEMKLECVRRLGLKFMGGNGLVVQGSALIAHLARARKGRGRAR